MIQHRMSCSMFINMYISNVQLELGSYLYLAHPRIHCPNFFLLHAMHFVELCLPRVSGNGCRRTDQLRRVTGRRTDRGTSSSRHSHNTGVIATFSPFPPPIPILALSSKAAEGRGQRQRQYLLIGFFFPHDVEEFRISCFAKRQIHSY